MRPPRALLLLAAALSPAAAAVPCSELLPGRDATGPVRCAALPDGLPNTTAAACCAACNAQPDCVAYVVDTGRGGTCWPLAAYAGTAPAGERTFGGAPSPPPPPPPPPPPADWAAKVLARDMLYAPTDAGVNPSHMPMIGNGFLATQISSDSVYVAGVFNGYLTRDPSHRARLPATAAVAPPGAPGPAALDMREATYFRRSFLDPSPPGACTDAAAASCSNAPGRITVEQRWYAHRARPAVMVMEVQVLDGGGARAAGARAAAPFAMLLLRNAPGAASADVALAPAPGAPPGAELQCGATRVGETNASGVQSVCVLTTALPAAPLRVDAAAPHATFTFLTVVRTSIETAAAALPAAAAADYAAAAAAAAAGALRAEHVAEWAATIWPSGFETDRADLARAANSSLYAILSSVRDDRPFGLSPGGLTAGYNGAPGARRRSDRPYHPPHHTPLTPPSHALQATPSGIRRRGWRVLPPAGGRARQTAALTLLPTPAVPGHPPLAPINGADAPRLPPRSPARRARQGRLLQPALCGRHVPLGVCADGRGDVPGDG